MDRAHDCDDAASEHLTGHSLCGVLNIGSTLAKDRDGMKMYDSLKILKEHFQEIPRNSDMLGCKKQKSQFGKN